MSWKETDMSAELRRRVNAENRAIEGQMISVLGTVNPLFAGMAQGMATQISPKAKRPAKRAKSPIQGHGATPAEVRYPVLSIWSVQGIPLPEVEFQFHPTRKWRYDFAWPAHKLALESDGGVWVNGGHNRGSGWIKDTEKRNAAAVLGWRLLRFQPSDLSKTSTIETIRQALQFHP